ncbi:MAG: hypothetical protein TQ37_07650 [Candidatus Synechococcus spongiarum 15L]|uniref:Uncharacterized protein n=1 Tax=Candidatus Synechococcus spongiarum 15L TaxID=1608419 RepID=A0A0G8AT62_9SYNE|nr:MAG: hypothetical protein TQ37_07650 [Candidatus Synechococcus spongiarum 15L]
MLIVPLFLTCVIIPVKALFNVLFKLILPLVISLCHGLIILATPPAILEAEITRLWLWPPPLIAGGFLND